MYGWVFACIKVKLESENHLLYHLHHFHLSTSVCIHSDCWIWGSDFCLKNRLYPCSYDFAQPSLWMRPSAVRSKQLESSPCSFLPADFRQVVQEFCTLVSFLENSDFDNTCLPPSAELLWELLRLYGKGLRRVRCPGRLNTWWLLFLANKHSLNGRLFFSWQST